MKVGVVRCWVEILNSKILLQEFTQTQITIKITYNTNSIHQTLFKSQQQIPNLWEISYVLGL